MTAEPTIPPVAETSESQPLWRVLFEDLIADVRYALRQLRKNLGFTLAAVLTLALGIGVNTALFTVFDALLLRPLPLHEPHRLVNIAGNQPRSTKGSSTLSFPDFLEYWQANRLFSHVVATTYTRSVIGDMADGGGAAGGGSNSSFIPFLFVSDNYFDALRPSMTLGRPFTGQGGRPAMLDDGVVLSHRCWQSRFSSDPAVVGKTIRLNNRNLTIVGVAGPDFMGTDLMRPVAGWAPMATAPNFNRLERSRRNVEFELIGKLKPGVSQSQGEADLQAICRSLRQKFPNAVPAIERVALSGAGTLVPLPPGTKLPTFVIVVFIGFAVIMGIACANVVNLLLARASGRQREIAIRLATGSSRGRLVRQLLTESLVLSVLGAVAGIILSYWMLRGLYVLTLTSLPEIPDTTRELFSVNLAPDVRVYGFALALATLAGVVTGLAPALAASRADVNALLQGGGSLFNRGLAQSKLRNGLVVVQVALSLTLLVGAALFVRNLRAQMSVEIGMDTAHGIMVEADWAGGGAVRPGSGAFLPLLEQRLKSFPGVAAVGLSNCPILGGPNQSTSQMKFKDSATSESTVVSQRFSLVTPAYLSALGVPIDRGRMFTPDEAAADAAVVVISASAAQRHWPGRDAIGKQVLIETSAFKGRSSRGTASDQTMEFRTCEVIGVARDAVYADLFDSDRAHFFLPSTAGVRPFMVQLHIRTERDPRAILREIRAIVESSGGLLKRQALLSEAAAAARAPAAISALLAAALGGLGLCLAVVGLSGVLTYQVNRRQREIGIRLAIGASPFMVVKTIVSEGMRLVLIGSVLGLVVGVASVQVVVSMVSSINPVDPISFIFATVVLFILGLIACALPAFRASRINPVIALRTE
jgi:macrolide transport system ATP-binding/permease protein